MRKRAAEECPGTALRDLDGRNGRAVREIEGVSWRACNLGVAHAPSNFASTGGVTLAVPGNR